MFPPTVCLCFVLSSVLSWSTLSSYAWKRNIFNYTRFQVAQTWNNYPCNIRRLIAVYCSFKSMLEAHLFVARCQLSYSSCWREPCRERSIISFQMFYCSLMGNIVVFFSHLNSITLDSYPYCTNELLAAFRLVNSSAVSVFLFCITYAIQHVTLDSGEWGVLLC